LGLNLVMKFKKWFLNRHLNFNTKLYTIFNLLFIIIFFFWNNLQKQNTIFDFRLNKSWVVVSLKDLLFLRILKLRMACWGWNEIFIWFLDLYIKKNTLWWFMDWKVLLLFIVFILFIYQFIIFIICIYSEIKFIKPLDDVKIWRKTITFTKDWKSRTIFINKKINSGIMRMFIFFFTNYIFIYSILLAKCYAFEQIIVVFLVWEIFLYFF
jgi:hypothetical protein